MTADGVAPLSKAPLSQKGGWGDCPSASTTKGWPQGIDLWGDYPPTTPLNPPNPPFAKGGLSRWLSAKGGLSRMQPVVLYTAPPHPARHSGAPTVIPA